MDNTYGEFQGTELDPSLDFEFDEDENDLVPILGLAAVVAAIIGGLLVLLGRRRKPTPAERAQDVLETAAKEGRKSLKAAAKAVDESKLGDLLDEAISRAGKVTKNGNLADLLDEARKKVADATERVDLAGAVGEVRKGAIGAGAAGGAALLQDALHRAMDASGRVDLSKMSKQVRKAGKRAVKAAQQVETPQLDGAQAGKFLDDLRERLVDAVESVRSDVAPRAADVLKSEVIPAAQGAVERLREDVIPSAQERAVHLAEEYEVVPRARKAASATMEGAGSLGAVLRTVALAVLDRVVKDVLPQAEKMGKKAVTTAREDVLPVAAETASEAVHRVREDVLPKVGEAAAHTPDMLSDLLHMARERVSEAMEKAQPVVAGAAEKGAHGAGAVVAGIGKGGKGAGGAVSSARHGVTGAVGTAVDATKYATRETTGILFWLSMLGGVVLLVFMPEREKQEELWNNARQFLGEAREMWRDLQGPEYEYETGGDTSTV